MKVNIVFDGPPGHTPGRFVEAEDAKTARSVNIGTWKKYRAAYEDVGLDVSGTLANDWWVLQTDVLTNEMDLLREKLAWAEARVDATMPEMDSVAIHDRAYAAGLRDALAILENT